MLWIFSLHKPSSKYYTLAYSTEARKKLSQSLDTYNIFSDSKNVNQSKVNMGFFLLDSRECVRSLGSNRKTKGKNRIMNMIEEKKHTTAEFYV